MLVPLVGVESGHCSAVYYCFFLRSYGRCDVFLGAEPGLILHTPSLNVCLKQTLSSTNNEILFRSNVTITFQIQKPWQLSNRQAVEQITLL